MELMTAVLGLRLAKCLESELSTEVEKRVFWTDAQDVLFWIKSDARKYPRFVALRVGEILEGSEVGEWRWVPSELNVADDGTKWSKGVEVNNSIRWFSGPNYLLQDESEWPLGKEISKARETQVLYHKEESKKQVSPLASVMPDPLRFSKLERLRLRALVKEIIKNCPVCCIMRAQPSPPMMGILPKERLSPYTLPFTFTGVDYFGPIEVANWYSLYLRTHLFTARRGVPLKLLSDNGTNFRGASRVLAQEIERISTSAVERKYSELSFSFIPPGSPHMGGCWERMVRSKKSILTEILSNAGLREEVLRTALADVECTLNSRPFTYIPLESENLEALTPNHFLVGNCSGLRERGSMEANG
ncbi:uncharacterized protein [Drosophila takahashii]|uniref:uncharacterized protein n=1 Tax=Drosophila takahashii TaxID=29030 RepID=UPI00389956D3